MPRAMDADIDTRETVPRRMDLLEPWRLRVVRPFVRGRLLDLACGYNNLTRAHGGGVGADVYPWKGIDVRIEDAARLPFRDGSFDTVSVLAALNHIPNREATLLAVMRVLRPGGLFLATMIGPWTGGRLAHLLFHQDEARRGAAACDRTSSTACRLARCGPCCTKRASNSYARCRFNWV